MLPTLALRMRVLIGEEPGQGDGGDIYIYNVCVCVCVSFVTPLETNIIDLWVPPLNLGGLKTMHVAAFE